MSFQGFGGRFVAGGSGFVELFKYRGLGFTQALALFWSEFRGYAEFLEFFVGLDVIALLHLLGSGIGGLFQFRIGAGEG